MTEEIDSILASLDGRDGDERDAVLSSLAKHPVGDTRVIERVERMLADTSIIDYVPGVYGACAERRLVAALALAACRRAAGDVSPVVVQARPAVEGASRDSYQRAIERGLLAERDFVLLAPVPLETYLAKIEWPAPVAAPAYTNDPAKPATLREGDVAARVALLQVFATNPSGDPEMRAAVEQLLTDRTLTALTIPHRYGELGILAAHALAAEQHARGDDTPVRFLAPPLVASPREHDPTLLVPYELGFGTRLGWVTHRIAIGLVAGDRDAVDAHVVAHGDTLTVVEVAASGFERPTADASAPVARALRRCDGSDAAILETLRASLEPDAAAWFVRVRLTTSRATVGWLGALAARHVRDGQAIAEIAAHRRALPPRVLERGVGAGYDPMDRPERVDWQLERGDEIEIATSDGELVLAVTPLG